MNNTDVRFKSIEIAKKPKIRLANTSASPRTLKKGKHHFFDKESQKNLDNENKVLYEKMRKIEHKDMPSFSFQNHCDIVQSGS